MKIFYQLALVIALAMVPATAQNAEKVGGGLWRKSFAKLGDWQVDKYSQDIFGQRSTFCAATISTAPEEGLRIAFNKLKVNYGFMAEASSALGTTPSITYWFGANRAASRTVQARFGKTPEDSVEWVNFWRDRNDDEIFDWSNPSNASVTFSYRFQGRTIVQKIPLRGAPAAIDKLIACAETLR